MPRRLNRVGRGPVATTQSFLMEPLGASLTNQNAGCHLWSPCVQLRRLYTGPLLELVYNGVTMSFYPTKKITFADGTWVMAVDKDEILNNLYFPNGGTYSGGIWGERYCRVSRIYDQSGNAIDGSLIQPTADYRPIMNPRLIQADGLWPVSFTARGAMDVFKNNSSMTGADNLLSTWMYAPNMSAINVGNHAIFSVMEVITNSGTVQGSSATATNQAFMSFVSTTATMNFSLTFGNGGAPVPGANGGIASPGPGDDPSWNTGLLGSSNTNGTTLIRPTVDNTSGGTLAFGAMIAPTERSAVVVTQGIAVCDVVNNIAPPTLSMNINNQQIKTVTTGRATGPSNIVNLGTSTGFNWNRRLTENVTGTPTNANGFGVPHNLYACGIYGRALFDSTTGSLATAQVRWDDRVPFTDSLMKVLGVKKKVPASTTHILALGSSSISSFVSICNGPMRQMQTILEAAGKNVRIDEIAEPGTRPSVWLATNPGAPLNIANSMPSGYNKNIMIMFTASNATQNLEAPATVLASIGAFINKIHQAQPTRKVFLPLFWYFANAQWPTQADADNAIDAVNAFFIANQNSGITDGSANLSTTWPDYKVIDSRSAVPEVYAKGAYTNTTYWHSTTDGHIREDTGQALMTADWAAQLIAGGWV